MALTTRATWDLSSWPRCYKYSPVHCALPIFHQNAFSQPTRPFIVKVAFFLFFWNPHRHLLCISGERRTWNYLAANPLLCLICCRHLQIDGASWIPQGEIWSAWQIKSLQKCGRSWFHKHNVGPKLELECLSSQGVPVHRTGYLEGPLRLFTAISYPRIKAQFSIQ